MKNALVLILSSLDRIVIFCLKWLTILLFVCLTLILTANIVIRFVPIMSLHWFDEIVELLYSALVFYGAAGVWIARGHFSVGDWISRFVRSERTASAYRLLITLGCLLFVGIFFFYSLELTLRSREATPVIGMPKAVLYSCMPISSAIMCTYTVRDVVAGLRRLLRV